VIVPAFDELAAITGGRWLGTAPSGAVPGVGIDSREALAGRLFVAIKGDRFDGHDFLSDAQSRGAAAAMVDRDGAPLPPPLPLPLPLLGVLSTRHALAALGREWRRRFDGGAAAITGSCGKTTTRRLLASIMERLGPTVQSPRSFNNDLGVPLTVLALAPDHRFLVAEIGMNHAGEIRPLAEIVAPQVAVITSIGPVHLEALGSVEAIAQEKASIIAGVGDGGSVVFPAESGPAQDAVRHASRASIERITFGLHAGDVQMRSRRATRDGSQVEIDGPWGRLAATLALPGEHNAMNAVAAAAAAHRLGAPADAIVEGLAAVEPSEMRFVRERIGPVTIVNDAYNANPMATRASVRAFAELEASAPRRVTVLGDMLELGADAERLHRELGEWLAEDDSIAPDLAVFVGPVSEAAAEGYRRTRPGAAMLVLPDPGAASAAVLREALAPGDAVLFKASRGSALERLIPPLREAALRMSGAAGTAEAAGTAGTAGSRP